MAEIEPFSLYHLKQIVEGNNEQAANNYISQNLAVARNVKLDLVRQQLVPLPRLMKEMRILSVKRGWASPIVNLEQQYFETGDLVFLGPNGVLQYNDAADDVKGMGLSMSNELFSLAIGNHMPRAFDGHIRFFKVRLQDYELEFLDTLHASLYNHLNQPEPAAQVTLHLIASFLWYVDALWNRYDASARKSHSREQILYSDFMQLVNIYAAAEHNIDFYASRLCLSARYMSTIVKKVSGKSAKQWIDDTIIVHTKINLKHTNKTVAQICDEMNFPNPSFFSKYFKRLTGMTPLQYRLSH